MSATPTDHAATHIPADAPNGLRIMRVAFCGASGTGKTTLMQYVADRYGLRINTIGSRTVAKGMGFASPYDVDQAGRRAEFQRALLMRKRGWEMTYNAFVTDRTVVDNLAYHSLHDISSVNEETLAEVAFGMRRYTHVIHCPVRAFCNLGADPARVHDMAYHAVYEALLEGLLRAYAPAGVEVFVLAQPDLPGRKLALDELLAG